MQMENEIVLVTGASRGIGRAIALALGKKGATIIGTATSDNGAQNIAKYMDENGVKGSGEVLNVTDQGSIDTLLKTVTEKSGAPTILVNNAGITRDNLLMRMKEDEWDDIINTNLSSVYRLSKSCLRAMMKARRGKIVNIASVVALTGNPGQCNYAAAKSGMIGFSKALAREVASRGITVNCVAPGFIETDMTHELPEKQKEALLQSIPLNRLGRPDEVAGAVEYLTSPVGDYITGETINVNGGMYMA
ncbi:MAG: 3-oxoacyl-ACP reductase FabG [Gammaproteobacteria bacterium]|nr:3-oxoacyl-ACP reductase FabG [Gammaproteobacteria bacterium]